MSLPSRSRLLVKPARSCEPICTGQAGRVGEPPERFDGPVQLADRDRLLASHAAEPMTDLDLRRLERQAHHDGIAGQRSLVVAQVRAGLLEPDRGRLGLHLLASPRDPSDLRVLLIGLPAIGPRLSVRALVELAQLGLERATPTHQPAWLRAELDAAARWTEDPTPARAQEAMDLLKRNRELSIGPWVSFRAKIAGRLVHTAVRAAWIAATQSGARRETQLKHASCRCSGWASWLLRPDGEARLRERLLAWATTISSARTR